jgi:hypothetical protein
MVAASVMLAGCVPPGVACPAIGYVYAGPVLIDVDSSLLGGQGTVEACFGADCRVAPIERGADGLWVLPQKAPHTEAGGIGLEPGAVVRVAVTRSGTTFDHSVEVPYQATTDGWCPGPVTFETVVID